jgi:hypothetical protein
LPDKTAAPLIVVRNTSELRVDAPVIYSRLYDGDIVMAMLVTLIYCANVSHIPLPCRSKRATSPER